MNDRSSDCARRIADELASCGVKLVASLPDNWVMDVINTIKNDDRFVHVPVNREESAIGLCSGAFFGGTGAFALMGASGFLTCIYALTKINYTYQVPLLIGITMRGHDGDDSHDSDRRAGRPEHRPALAPRDQPQPDEQRYRQPCRHREQERPAARRPRGIRQRHHGAGARRARNRHQGRCQRHAERRGHDQPGRAEGECGHAR